jgi:hypothetical protein
MSEKELISRRGYGQDNRPLFHCCVFCGDGPNRTRSLFPQLRHAFPLKCYQQAFALACYHGNAINNPLHKKGLLPHIFLWEVSTVAISGENKIKEPPF